MTRRIDSHLHLYPPEVNRDPAGWAAAAGEGRWAAAATRRRKSGVPVQGFPAEAELLRALDAAGVERGNLLGWYWEHPESCGRQNRFYSGVLRRHRDRLSAFAVFHPSAGVKAVEGELRRARTEGFSGLGELSPHAQGYALGDPAFRRALELAAEWNWPVNFHTSDPEGRPYPGMVATPAADFLGLAADFPSLRFILSHWGGLMPLRQPAAVASANLLYDSAASPLTYGPEIWRRMVGAVGADRIVFGSDYPLNLYPASDAEPAIGRLVAEAENAGLSPDELEAVFSGNFGRLAGASLPDSR